MQIKLNKDQIYCNLLLIAFILYYTQSLFFNAGVIGPLFAILIVIISIVYFFKIINKGMHFIPFAKLWLIFILYQTTVYIFSGEHSRNFGVFQRMLLNTMPFFAFYYFIIRGVLTTKHFNYFLAIALPLFILNFYKTYSFLQDYRNSENIIVTAAIYMFIGLLPFVFMIKNKLIASLSLLTIWYFLIQSNKKAAIFCGIVTILIFAWQNIFTNRKKISLKSIFFSIIILTGLSYFSYNFYIKNEFLQKRMNTLFESGDNVRERIAEETFNAWYNSDNILTYLFGLGYDSSRDITGTSSHNDVVDAITSFGLVGFTIYLLIFFSLFKIAFKNGWNRDKRFIMFVFLSIAIIMSMSSRWYSNAFPYMITLFLPYLLLTRKQPIQ